MAGSCVGMRGSTSHAEYGESLLQAPLNGGLVIGAQSWQLSACPPRLRLLHSFTDIASGVLSPYALCSKWSRSPRRSSQTVVIATFCLSHQTLGLLEGGGAPLILMTVLHLGPQVQLW